MRRTAYTRDSEVSSKFKTPQGYVNEIKFGKSTNSSNKVPLSSKRDADEDLNQEIIQLVKVRVEELQSKMKSKSDMFYVLRHMCKIFYCLSILCGYHLPEYDCPIQFMRDILSGFKKVCVLTLF